VLKVPVLSFLLLKHVKIQWKTAINPPIPGSAYFRNVPPGLQKVNVKQTQPTCLRTVKSPVGNVKQLRIAFIFFQQSPVDYGVGYGKTHSKRL